MINTYIHNLHELCKRKTYWYFQFCCLDRAIDICGAIAKDRAKYSKEAKIKKRGKLEER